MKPKAAAAWAYFLAVQKALDVRGDCLEIGVFRGWGSFLPAKHLIEGERCILVDISRHNLEASATFLRESVGAADAQLTTVLVDSAGGNASERIKASSNEIRWVHIDGEHSYAGVFQDLTTASQMCSSNAVICVDDVDHALATCINDAMLDWLDANRTWQLCLRGYNKAYIVSTRSTIDWHGLIAVLPEVFERFFGLGTVLASQSSNARSRYYSYGEPFKQSKYLRVNNVVEDLEAFEGLDRRAFLVGESNRPEVLLFGNCQIQVLAGALTASADLAGMKVRFRHVADVHELDAGSAEKIRSCAKNSVGLLTQVVQGDKFLVRSDELESIVKSPLLLRVPSIHFNGYWPNQADLRITSGSTMAGPADAVAYAMIEAGASNEEIVAALCSDDLYETQEVLDWASAAYERLRTREVQHGLNVCLSDLFDPSRLSTGERELYTFNHPKKKVMDSLMIRCLFRFREVFEPRYREVFDAIVSGETAVRYDMSTIDFIDYPMLPSVAKAFGNRGVASSSPAKYVRPRGSGDIHKAVPFAVEVSDLRARYGRLDAAAREFNRAQIQQTCSLPVGVRSMSPS